MLLEEKIVKVENNKMTIKRAIQDEDFNVNIHTCVYDISKGYKKTQIIDEKIESAIPVKTIEISYEPESTKKETRSIIEIMDIKDNNNIGDFFDIITVTTDSMFASFKLKSKNSNEFLGFGSKLVPEEDAQLFEDRKSAMLAFNSYWRLTELPKKEKLKKLLKKEVEQYGN